VNGGDKVQEETSLGGGNSTGDEEDDSQRASENGVSQGTTEVGLKLNQKEKSVPELK
jgi:hypothetical protein